MKRGRLLLKIVHRKPGGTQLILRKVTPAFAQIVACISQDVDQLETATVLPTKFKHLRFGPISERKELAETKACPKLANTTGDEIGVFAQFFRISESGQPAAPSCQVKELTPRNRFQQDANVCSIFRC